MQYQMIRIFSLSVVVLVACGCVGGVYKSNNYNSDTSKLEIINNMVVDGILTHGCGGTREFQDCLFSLSNCNWYRNDKILPKSIRLIIDNDKVYYRDSTRVRSYGILYITAMSGPNYVPHIQYIYNFKVDSLVKRD